MKHVIFDIGNVLLQWNPQPIIEEILPNRHMVAKAMAMSFEHELWTLFDAGVLTEKEVLVKIQKELKIPIETVQFLFEKAMHSLTPVPGSVELLTELHQNHIPLYCITNMNLPFWDYLQDSYSFWSMFKAIVVSAKVRLIKPDPDIYWHLLV